MPTRDTPEADFIRRNFQAVWPVHLAGFTRLLVHLRARFEGDLDRMLVLAAIGGRIRPEGWRDRLEDAARLTRPAEAAAPINIQSVADYTGIPRETVRRKVAWLEQKGWVARDADGHLSATRAAAVDLDDATGATVAYLAALAAALEAARIREAPPRG